MRTTQLLILPLVALLFVFFIYYLAEKSITPPTVKSSPVNISKLQIIESKPNTKKNILLTEAPPHLNANAEEMATDWQQANTSIRKEEAFGLIHVKMYNQKPFSDEQYSFLPSDRIYLVIEFENLAPGEHLLSASWINPEGQTVSIADHTISLKSPEINHRSYFWLELMKNGGFTEMITGKEYKGNVYGSWKVEVYLNGKSVALQNFIIQDT